MMKICFMGSMEFAVPILEGLHKKYDIELVVTQPDKPVGRKRILTPTKVKEKAMELGLKIFQPTNIKTDFEAITSLELDLIIVAAYGQMIPEHVLSHAKYQAINVHASLLPKYRGGSPMHRAIQYGDSETGVTIMFMAMKMDSGDILSQKSIPILETDNVGSIEKKLGILGRDLLLETLEKIDQIKPVKQNENAITYAFNIKPEEERIQFDKDARDIYNHVRAFNPWPLTYAVINGLKLKLHEVEYENRNLSSIPGEVVISEKDQVGVQCLNGIVYLKEIQLQGKKQLAIKDFMNGQGKTLLQKGNIFESIN